MHRPDLENLKEMSENDVGFFERGRARGRGCGAFTRTKNNQARQRPGWEGAEGESAQAACTDVVSAVSSNAVCADAISAISSNAVGTHAISAISSHAVCTHTVSAISSYTFCTDAISAISRHTVGTDTIGAIRSDATQVGVIRTVFGNNRCIQVLAGIDSGQCECAGCQYGEGQAKDQGVGFHEGCSRIRSLLTRYGGNVTRRWIIKKSIVLVAIIAVVDS